MTAAPGLYTLDTIAEAVRSWKAAGVSIVFTNGCFDLLHPGHTRYLRQARELGDLLIVGINSDDSVRRLKGPSRPIMTEPERAEVLLSLRWVDVVVPFAEDTPLDLIRRVVPDVLVKGGDWPVETIVGRDVVEQAGGRVISLPFHEGASTTEIIRRIIDASP